MRPVKSRQKHGRGDKFGAAMKRIVQKLEFRQRMMQCLKHHGVIERADRNRHRIIFRRYKRKMKERWFVQLKEYGKNKQITAKIIMRRFTSFVP